MPVKENTLKEKSQLVKGIGISESLPASKTDKIKKSARGML